MQHDPFAQLDLEQIEEAERKARRAHPIPWRVAELLVFVKDPPGWVRSWTQRNRVGYHGKPQ